ncbi:hypothetical protein [Spiroplasma sp. AdecLV25b]|uniref:hypothetical protein n=1 Tax=Spiroplasma sp. AdecLV25b TaxID=3027162 RepID=UPI0027DF9F9F|nr:hypothetical protein [Spiroplasma sp. AdecLV25b]
MKKILSITSSLILTSSTVTILATNVNNYQTISNKVNIDNINWCDVKNYNNNYFKNIKENYYKNPTLNLLSLKNNKEVDINKIINYAQETTNNYVVRFKNKNFNLNKIISVLSKDNLEFAKNYNNVLIRKNNVLKNPLLSSQNLRLLKDTSFYSLENYVYNLKIAKTTFITISAAVAAAGFWAAAWWFGISIPSHRKYSNKRSCWRSCSKN